MSQTVTAGRTAGYDKPTGWIGWAAFAAIMMIIAGSLQAIYGLVAVLNDQWVVWGNRGSMLLDISTWGWLHLAVGAVVALAGIGIFTGNALARGVGVVVAALSLVANFLFLPAYPIWAMVVIAIDALVIYALIAHGRELKAD